MSLLFPPDVPPVPLLSGMSIYLRRFRSCGFNGISIHSTHAVAAPPTRSPRRGTKKKFYQAFVAHPPFSHQSPFSCTLQMRVLATPTEVRHGGESDGWPVPGSDEPETTVPTGPDSQPHKIRLEISLQ